MLTKPGDPWRPLGAVATTDLRSSRLELHWAAQIACACADAWLERRADDSHTSMAWNFALDALVGEPAPSGLAIAIRPRDLTVLAVRGDRIEHEVPLAGRTLLDGVMWADVRLSEAANASPRHAQVRDYDMPEHPVSSGVTFSQPSPALTELAAWYADGVLALTAATPDTSLRVWPHHFDLGGIIFLNPISSVASSAEHARQIGVGLSPGDGSYAEPYFYVTPYPIADGVTFPKLEGGHWHREGFTGAILTATELLAKASTPDAQATAAGKFLASALAGARAVIPPAR